MSTQSRSAVKNRDLSTSPQLWAPATCGFVGKNRCVLGKFRFFTALLLRTELAIAQYNPPIALTGKPIQRLA